jgi:hypothetical protein
MKKNIPPAPRRKLEHPRIIAFGTGFPESAIECLRDAAIIC